ncbi:hypothetical protein IGI04_020696 [Brassica rapa subsp. trilocularis]|uniref:Uncharacterized protein n=1 Tax=Brassica rapa subsp. trilocularis TaxID=1813537 RepID=A0ABQ7MJH9_BRACM|nr:hypothetical protein IGI04_020696 [Brassica rapa subsp. trilocularis]
MECESLRNPTGRRQKVLLLRRIEFDRHLLLSSRVPLLDNPVSMLRLIVQSHNVQLKQLW